MFSPACIEVFIVLLSSHFGINFILNQTDSQITDNSSFRFLKQLLLCPSLFLFFSVKGEDWWSCQTNESSKCFVVDRRRLDLSPVRRKEDYFQSPFASLVFQNTSERVKASERTNEERKEGPVEREKKKTPEIFRSPLKQEASTTDYLFSICFRVCVRARVDGGSAILNLNLHFRKSSSNIRIEL